MNDQAEAFLGHTKYDEDDHLVATQSLRDHLLNTKKLAEQYGKELGISHITGLAAILHDLGKYRPEFQEYVRHQGNHKRGSVDHSSFGAMFIRQYIDAYIKQLGRVDKKTVRIVQELGDILANSIFSHHDSLGLKDFLDPSGFTSPFIERTERFNDQGVNQEELDQVCDYFFAEVIEQASFNRYLEAAIGEYSEIKTAIQQAVSKCLHGIPEAEKQTQILITIQRDITFLNDFVYSCLLDADRTDTAAFEFGVAIKDSQPVERNSIFKNYYQKLLEYLSHLNTGQVSPINQYRTEISADCDKAAERPSDIYTLSAPTGAGKTLASLRYALKHSYLYGKQHIIYVLPYITIIEQNASVTRKVLNGSENNTENILEFHSNVSNELKHNRNEQTDVLDLAEDSWDAPIIFTTMVQFLNTIYASRTSNRRRFHNLCNSVIIFDEVQKVPTKCLALFNQAVNFLKQVGHSDLVLCSATQPALNKIKGSELQFAEKPEIITDLNKKVEQFRRVKLVDRTQDSAGKDLQADGEEIAKMIFSTAQKVKSVLGIFNTIKATTEVYTHLKPLLMQSGTQTSLYYLSTNMCPQHRKDKIAEMIDKVAEMIDKVKAGKRVICISTPLIEAGVDVGFAAVYRSATGVDSIIQAAGRCNRNNETDFGEVYVVNDQDEELGQLLDIQTGKDITINNLLPKYPIDQMLEHGVISNYFSRFFYRTSFRQKYPVESHDFELSDLVDGLETCKKYYQNCLRFPIDIKQFSSLATIAKHFQVIDNDQRSVIAPYKQGKNIISELNADLEPGKHLVNLLKKAQPFLVNVYENKMSDFWQSDAVYKLNTGNFGGQEIFAFRQEAYEQLVFEDEQQNIFYF